MKQLSFYRGYKRYEEKNEKTFCKEGGKKEKKHYIVRCRHTATELKIKIGDNGITTPADIALFKLKLSKHKDRKKYAESVVFTHQGIENLVKNENHLFEVIT